MKLMYCLISMFMCLVLILMSSGWFTLLERKVLSYSQLRVGPNKVSLGGMLMPLVDFIKLAVKNSVVPSSNMLMFSMCMKMLVSVVLLSFCKYHNYMAKSHMMIYLMVVSSLMGYAIILPSLTTKSIYSVLGMMRMFVMILSFEISLFLLIVVMNYLSMGDEALMTMFMLPIMSIICLLIFTMEMSRHPFEVIEGESELVSGFNVELSSLVFMVFFLSEMMNITVMTIIMCYIYQTMLLYVQIIMLILLFRSSYPRMRYDLVMIFQWSTMYMVMISLMYLC